MSEYNESERSAHNVPNAAELQVFADRLTGFYTRPGDLRFILNQVRALGVGFHAFSDETNGVVFQQNGESYRFSTGISRFDELIATMIQKADVIAAALLVVYGGRNEVDYAASNGEINEAVNVVETLYGKNTLQKVKP